VVEDNVHVGSIDILAGDADSDYCAEEMDREVGVEESEGSSSEGGDSGEEEDDVDEGDGDGMNRDSFDVMVFCSSF